MTIIKTISISEEFMNLSREYNISWTNAARVGMSILLADLGVKEYDNQLNLYRRMLLMKSELERVSNELEALKEKAHTDDILG